MTARPDHPTANYGTFNSGSVGPLNPDHGLCRFLAVTYGRAADWHCHAGGPGLKALERIEAAYADRLRHVHERHPDFRSPVHWLRHASPTEVQVEIERGWLSVEADVWTVFGCTRHRLWGWAEADRQLHMRSALAVRTLGEAGAADAARPRENPFPVPLPVGV